MHQHMESVGHGKERSAQVRARVVRVPEAQLHSNVDRFHVGRDVTDTNARAQKRRPEVDPAAHRMGTLGTAETLQENVAALHADSQSEITVAAGQRGHDRRPLPEFRRRRG